MHLQSTWLTILLFAMATEITDVGLTPYPAVRRILLNINSAAQLRQLELASPHLEGDDAECWIRLIQKDFPVLSKKHDFEPRNPASWHKVYSKYQRLEEETKRAATEKLKSAFAGIKQQKASNVASVVDFDRRRLPKLPKDGRGLAGERRVRGQAIASTNGLRFTGGTKTKVTDAASIMRKARREAAAIGARNRLDTNSANLQRGHLAQAPKGLVNEYKIQARPAARGMPSTGGRVPAVRPPVPSARRIDRDLEEREARLRKMTSLANARKNTTVVSDDELEDEDDIGYEYEEEGYDDSGGGGGGLDADDLEDIFDDNPTPPPQSRSSSSRQPPPSSSSSSARRSGGGGLLSNAPGASSRSGALASRPSTTPRPRPASPPPPSRSNNNTSPAKPLASSSSTGPTQAPPPGPGGPLAQRKRKAVDVFMKKKPKMARP